MPQGEVATLATVPRNKDAPLRLCLLGRAGLAQWQRQPIQDRFSPSSTLGTGTDIAPDVTYQWPHVGVSR